MTLDWLFIGTIIVVGAGMAALPIALNTIIAPRKPNKTKLETYECGIEIAGDAWVQLKGQYYIFGLIFLIFDIEAIFLFPWAVAYDRLQFYMVLDGGALHPDPGWRTRLRVAQGGPRMGLASLDVANG